MGDGKAEEAGVGASGVSEDGTTRVATNATSSANSQLRDHAKGERLVLKRKKPIAAWRLALIFAW
jgi:hypothetical protein